MHLPYVLNVLFNAPVVEVAYGRRSWRQQRAVMAECEPRCVLVQSSDDRIRRVFGGRAESGADWRKVAERRANRTGGIPRRIRDGGVISVAEVRSAVGDDAGVHTELDGVRSPDPRNIIHQVVDRIRATEIAAVDEG